MVRLWISVVWVASAGWVGVWQAATGFNQLTAALLVDSQAGGEYDPNATEFAELP